MQGWPIPGAGFTYTIRWELSYNPNEGPSGSPNGLGKQAIRRQYRDPILQRGFIPRARARGHARTLRARALYGIPIWGSHVYTLPREVPPQEGQPLPGAGQGLAPRPRPWETPYWASP